MDDHACVHPIILYYACTLCYQEHSCFSVASLTFQATPLGINDCTTVPLSFPAETKNPNPYPSFVKVMHFCVQKDGVHAP